MLWMNYLKKVAEPDLKRRKPEPHEQIQEERKLSERNETVSDTVLESTENPISI